jgi:hypothetical protein
LVLHLTSAAPPFVQAQGKEDKEPPLPNPKVVAAWKDAGAVFGWMGVDDGALVF